MTDWTPWHFIVLIGMVCVTVILVVCLAAWQLGRLRAAEFAVSPEERAARLFGEAIVRCDGAVPADAVDTLSGIFAGASTEQKLAIVAAMSGLLDRAKTDRRTWRTFPKS